MEHRNEGGGRRGREGGRGGGRGGGEKTRHSSILLYISLFLVGNVIYLIIPLSDDLARNQEFLSLSLSLSLSFISGFPLSWNELCQRGIADIRKGGELEAGKGFERLGKMRISRRKEGTAAG